MCCSTSRKPAALVSVCPLALMLLGPPAVIAEGAVLDFVVAGAPVSQVLDRSNIIVRLTDSDSNLDSAMVETVSAVVSGQGLGDSESLTLLETGPSTGVFQAGMQLTPEETAANDGLLSSRAVFDYSTYDYSADRLTATAGALSTEAEVIYGRGFFTDPYGRETDRIALGEWIGAEILAPGIDHPTQRETPSWNVRDFTSYDSDYVELEEGKIRDRYRGADLLSAGGGSVEENRILETSLGHTLRGDFSFVTGQAVDTVQVVASRTVWVDVAGRAVTTVVPGRTLYIETFDALTSASSLTVQVTNGGASDSESITLYSVADGLFRGQLATTAADAVPGNGSLELDSAGGESVVATYNDGHGGSSTEIISAPAPPFRSALFVVGQTSPFQVGDQAVYSHMVSSGWSLTPVDDHQVATADADGHDLVVISSTVKSSLVGDKFRSVTIPVLAWEPYVLDDLGMTAGTAGLDYGSEPGKTQIEVRDPSSTLAAGFQGPVTVASAGRLTYGRPGIEALGIARVGSRPERLATFAYEAGATLADGGSAPARRVSTFLSDATASTLTAEGWRLFDEAVCWAVTCDGLPVARFTTTTSGHQGRTVSFNASASTAAPGASIVEFRWSFGDGGTAEGESTGRVYPSANYSDDHGFWASLTVVDSLGRSSQHGQAIWFENHAEVLLVTRSEQLEPGDAGVEDRLRRLGVRAHVVGHSGLQASNADGLDGVVISSSVTSAQVADTFRDVPVPVALWETHLFDDMAMTDGGTGSFGRDPGQSQLQIVDPYSPIADYLMGAVTISSGADLAWGAVTEYAYVIAASPVDPDHAGIFLYEAGDTRVDGLPTPAKRLGLWLGDDGLENLTTDGLNLFDRSMTWLLDD